MCGWEEGRFKIRGRGPPLLLVIPRGKEGIDKMSNEAAAVPRLNRLVSAWLPPDTCTLSRGPVMGHNTLEMFLAMCKS